MKANLEIRNLLNKYDLKYAEILPFLKDCAFTTRISEELSRPLTKERESDYLDAINKAKEEKKRIFLENYD